MLELRQKETIAACGLASQILTATRTGEVIGVRWTRSTRQSGSGRVPPSRMKAGREHRVALSVEALRVLRTMQLSDMAFLALLKRMGRSDLIPAGFRSSFRDRAAERTDHPGELVEMALAHPSTTRWRLPSGEATCSRNAAS